MMSLIEWVWNVILWCGQATVTFWDAVFGFIGDPTGVIAGNILLYVGVGIAGWYLTTTALAGWQIAHMPDQKAHRAFCQLQRNLHKTSCLTNHQQPCWTIEEYSAPPSDAQKESAVISSMVLGLFWWAVPLIVLVLIPLVVFIAPVALIVVAMYFAIAVPLVKLSVATGNGFVVGTAMVAEHTVESVMKRAEQISKHKALEAKKE